MIVEGKPLFVLVTRYEAPDGRVTVHTYGPWTQRKSAYRLRARIMAEYPSVETHTCKVLG